VSLSWLRIRFREKRGECVGKTKAGKGSMIMLSADANGTPWNTEVASASTYEGHLAEKTVDGIQVKKHGTRHKHPRQLIPKQVISGTKVTTMTVCESVLPNMASTSLFLTVTIV